MDFDLGEHEYIQLNQLLKVLGLAQTGGEANQRIVDGELRLNGAVELQKRKKLRPGDVVEFGSEKITIR
jgi:ribosome-associated protein